MGSTLIEKNLLLREEILPFKSWFPFRRETLACKWKSAYLERVLIHLKSSWKDRLRFIVVFYKIKSISLKQKYMCSLCCMFRFLEPFLESYIHISGMPSLNFFVSIRILVYNIIVMQHTAGLLFNFITQLATLLPSLIPCRCKGGAFIP